MRSALTLCLLLLPSVVAADDRLLFDFESPTYSDWTIEGEAFGTGPTDGTLPDQLEVTGYRGDRLVNSFRGGDTSVGAITSPEFTIDQPQLVFLIGGGRHEGETGIELLVDGRAVRSATGADSEVLRWHSWDVAEFQGQPARVRIFDRATGGWGHINVDHILLTDASRAGSGTWRIDDYRRSTEYYRERFRPQFHFTPELNWMNDPNGLVYLDGEYHLFYQHNPHGNSWGHMSWGHAVSIDLVHWKHLPIALHEEYGVMIFSGSAVVDRQNTSGFATGEVPPLVAIYTGHGHGRQTQDLAFSNDRGRTWTKYAGNPVLDLGLADFRDPKVFWHEPTSRWIMIVSLANEKKVRFYGSPDLKQWTHLSDFGPAGVRDKPNWECPDLFELPIEGEPGKTRWVLEADMGGGSVAGGSGGEYFVGTFDGREFRCDDPLDKVRWVDYGRDFYAPVSWSNIPANDGRRIWIGWMNNWETALLPTHPWRSAMSVPRTLSLRRTADGLQMIQTPVRELEALREDHVRLESLDIEGTTDAPGGRTLSGSRLELIAEFEVGTAKKFGFQLRKGGGEQTTVGYDTARGEMFVDRTQSGVVDFHPAFAGRHAAPLPAIDGRVRLRILLDESSVEVFGNDGAAVITDRIFPKPDNRGVDVYAVGGRARLRSLDVWQLRSVWHPDR